MFEKTSINKFDENIFWWKTCKYRKKHSKSWDQSRAAHFGQALAYSEYAFLAH